MRTRRTALALAAALLLATFGLGRIGQAEEAGDQAAALAPGEGAAFAMTNVTGTNQIIRYRRSADGTLTRVGSTATGGSGSGTDLDTQGGLQLAPDHRHLYAVNAGSDEVSVFQVDGAGLTLVQTVYAGDQPTSLTIHRSLLYVLDSSVAGNAVRGFRIASDGRLAALDRSYRKLSSPIAVPGQVQFSPDGKFLVVPHKATDDTVAPKSAIDVFAVTPDGRTYPVPKRNASNGLRPFSLAFRSDGTAVVAESFNAAAERSAVSSYDLSSTGALELLDGSVPDGQTDACWIVVTDDDRYAFVANFGSGTISSYRLGDDGDLELVAGAAASLGATSQPVDLALSADSKYLYLLLRGTGGVASFAVDGGALRPIGVLSGGGLRSAYGASGLATY